MTKNLNSLQTFHSPISGYIKMLNISQNILFYIVLLSTFINTVYLQVNSNKKCTLPNEKPGICKSLFDCPSAIEDKRKLGIDPKICGYNYNEPIICCKDEFNIETGNRFPGSQHNANPLDAHFVFPDDVGVSQSGPRKSEQKCMEYSKKLVQVVQAIPLVTNPEPITAVVPTCEYNSIPLIVGGKPAEPREFPHMALLGYNTGNKIEWLCGGTLISAQFILTAAHCISTRMGQPVRIRLGELNLKIHDGNSQPEDFNVETVFKHPEYKLPPKYHDIALIKLTRRVNFSSYIRPACLWTKYYISQNKTIATGWGHMEFAGTPSDALQKVALDIIDNNQCNSYYQDSRRYLPRGIEPSMICAGSLQGGKDTCQGDSGGPIQITNQENQCLFYIIGVTSFGKGCGTVNSPAVYTRVSEYISWIESIVWP